MDSSNHGSLCQCPMCNSQGHSGASKEDIHRMMGIDSEYTVASLEEMMLWEAQRRNRRLTAERDEARERARKMRDERDEWKENFEAAYKDSEYFEGKLEECERQLRQATCRHGRWDYLSGNKVRCHVCGLERETR